MHFLFGDLFCLLQIFWQISWAHAQKWSQRWRIIIYSQIWCSISNVQPGQVCNNYFSEFLVLTNVFIQVAKNSFRWNTSPYFSKINCCFWRVLCAAYKLCEMNFRGMFDKKLKIYFIYGLIWWFLKHPPFEPYRGDLLLLLL